MRIAVHVLAAALALAAPASAGELSAGNWRPTGCGKPIPPAIARDDTVTLNESVLRYNDYIAEVRRYDECLRAEADRDMRSIANGYEQLQADVLREADAARPRGTETR